MVKVLYPGSFDPLHNGHVEIVTTTSRLFDEIVVAAVENPGKSSTLFTFEERAAMIEESFASVPNVAAMHFSGLVVDLAAKIGADIIVKGLRSVTDFDSELQMAQMNRSVTGIVTVFVPSTSEDAYIASKFIREMAFFGADVSHLVPEPVDKRLQERFAR